MNLKRSVLKRFVALSQALGYRTTPILPFADLENFFNLVRPVETQCPLVRIGGHGDGGYLLPDDFSGISVCFSPGVGPTSAFEEDLAGRGIKSFLADYSVDKPASENAMFHFEKKFIGSYHDDKQMTLESWVNRNHADSSDLILQMDIEGNEYEVISHASQELLTRFRIIAIEFHELDELFCSFGLRIIQSAFAKLLKNFSVVHLHPNNCGCLARFKEYALPKTGVHLHPNNCGCLARFKEYALPKTGVHLHPNNCGCLARFKEYALPKTMEVTFLRKDRIVTQKPQLNFPHV